MFEEGRIFRAHQLLSHPLFTFLKMYVGRLGFLDAKPGLILSILYAYYTFVKYAKLWEIYKMRKQASPLGVKVARYVNAGSLFFVSCVDQCLEFCIQNPRLA